MKKCIFLLLIVFCNNLLFGGNTSDTKESSAKKLVSGKVIDQQTGEEIIGAEISIGDKTYYTDLNGNFSAMLPMTKLSGIVKFISYNDQELTIDPVSYSPIVVELKSK